MSKDEAAKNAHHGNHGTNAAPPSEHLNLKVKSQVFI
jgi:hypothetical protein